MPTTDTTSPRRRRLGRKQLVTSLIILVALLTSCDTGASPATALAENQQLLEKCDQAHPPASWVGIDGTSSSATDNIVAERMTAIESIVRETAVCSGVLKAVVFSSSSAATVTLFDASLRQAGATENAKLRRVPEAVDTTMATIEGAYEAAVSGLDQAASDITAQYRLASEWLRQLGGTHRLHLYLLTDGLQTAGINLGAHALDPQQAASLAAKVTVPQLPGATIVVAGLGRVADAPPPSATVEGLVAYYDALCQRMGATSCLSASEYQAAR